MDKALMGMSRGENLSQRDGLYRAHRADICRCQGK